MKPHLKLPCTILAAALQLAAIAAVQVAWTNSPSMPPYPLKPVPHGVPVDFRVTLRGYTSPLIAPGADLRLWFQTNGMGRAWWSAPATLDGDTVTASFGPAQDCGADRVSLFFGAPSNVFASAVLRLTHAPGFAPASLPLPVPVLDFSAVELRNLSALTNGWSFGGAPDNYDEVSDRAMKAVLWDNPRGYQDGSELDLGYNPLSWWGQLYIYPNWAAGPFGGFDFAREASMGQESAMSPLVIDGSPVVTSNMAERIVAPLSAAVAAADQKATTALQIVQGESVWFVVTNYMRTAQGVIPSLQLWEVRDGATNLVYHSREEITNTVRALTGEMRTELTNRIHEVEKAIPSRAWASYQSDGSDNPQPGEVAIVNQPTVLLTGGGTFNRYLTVGDSSVWVLASSGPVSFGGNTNGNFFAVFDDEGKPHFKVAKTDSYDLGAIISDVLPRQSANSILLYTAHTNSLGNAVTAPPVLSASLDLRESAWHKEEGGEVDALGLSVSWHRDDTIPAWVATITPDNWHPRLFLRATVTQEGGVSVINTAPARFDGGIQIGSRVYRRLVPYTTGDKTFLTLED